MSKTESFEFLNELALAFRAAENHPRPQCAPVLEGVRAVLAHLQSAGRLLADDETRLTAEQVEDVRALVWLDGRRNFDAFRRLRALFPATEPAEDAKPCGSNSVTLGWCKLTARHEGLHTNGTYLWGTPSEPDPPAPAEPAEERCQSVSIFRERCALVPGHDGRHAANGCAWGYPPAPAEPAEGVKPVKFRKMTPKYATANFGFPDVTVDPFAPFTRWAYKDSDGDKWVWNGDQWELHVVPSAPAEPAEEETKAERDSQGIIRINGGRIVALSRDPRELVQQWYDLAEPGSKWQRDYAAALDLFDREAASSPVVPAPTETGPWQRIEDVSEGVLQIKDRHGRTWLMVGGTWRFEWHDGNWHEPHTNINAQAPFVAAAKEG